MSMSVSRAFKSKLRKRMRLSVQNQKHSGVSSEVFILQLKFIRCIAVFDELTPSS